MKRSLTHSALCTEIHLMMWVLFKSFPIRPSLKMMLVCPKLTDHIGPDLIVIFLRNITSRNEHKTSAVIQVLTYHCGAGIFIYQVIQS